MMKWLILPALLPALLICGCEVNVKERKPADVNVVKPPDVNVKPPDVNVTERERETKSRTTITPKEKTTEKTEKKTTDK